MAKKRPKPLWLVSEWLTDKDYIAERWMALIIAALVLALWLK